jgi:hypothetical protein
MSMDMPGGYLGQGGQKVSMRPEWANDKYNVEKRASYPSRYAEAAASGEYRFVPTGEGFETHFGTRTQKWWPDTVVNEEDGVSYTEIPHFGGDEFRSQLESAMAMGVPRSQDQAHQIAANYVRRQMEKQGATDSQAFDAYNAMRKAHYDNSRARQYERWMYLGTEMDINP